MVKLALTGPLERWAPMGGARSSSPTATLSFGAGDHLRRGDRGGGAGPKTDTNAPRAHPPHTNRNANSFALAKRPSGHYLWTKVLEAGGLCISALSVSNTCFASAGGVAELSFCHGRGSQREHNGPIGQGQARLSFWPHTTSPFHLHHLQDPGALNKEVASNAGRRGSAWGGKYRSLA